MTSITTLLVDFLMDLFRDPDKAAEFRDDPERVLEAAGLGGVCGDDVDAVRPVILDFAPVSVDSSFDREYNTGRNESSIEDNNPFNPVFGGNNNDDDHGGGRGRDNDNGGGRGRDNDDDHDHGRDWDDDHAHAVQQLTHILNHYSYTSEVDDRDTIVDQSVNQNIWADGDVTQVFDNDSVVASGDESVAAGDDANVAYGDDSIAAGGDVDQDNSEDNSTNIDVDGDADIEIGSEDTTVVDSFNKEVDIDESFNEDNDGIDGNFNTVVVEETTNEDSFNDNSDNSVNDSFNPELEVDNSINDSGNEETNLEVDNSVNDSGNQETTLENVGNEETNVELENVGNEETTTELDVEFEESFNDTTTRVEDNVVLVDNEVEDDSALVVD